SYLQVGTRNEGSVHSQSRVTFIFRVNKLGLLKSECLLPESHTGEWALACKREGVRPVVVLCTVLGICLNFQVVMGESNNEVNWDLTENQAKFVKILKQFPVILEKSMIPECKRKRSCAMLEIKKLVEAEFKVCMTEGQLWKKIQNMKARIKKKADVNRTGNKKVVLKSWEEEFLNFMEADSNPSNVRMAGGMAAGVKPLTSLANEESDGDFSDEEEMEEVCLLQSAKKRKIETDASTSVQTSHSKKRSNLPETEETKQLSTPNLQRLVLLEQLKYFRKSQQLLDMKLKREMLKAANNVETHKTNQNDGPNDDLSGVMLIKKKNFWAANAARVGASDAAHTARPARPPSCPIIFLLPRRTPRLPPS
ncbi:hypothetical protein J6590_040869, partial [Homalodisca vitripennis]